MTLSGRSRYSSVAMLFHWVIALAVIVNWRLAETAHEVPKAEGGWWMDQHKALGITILVLTVLRLAWRFMHPVPPMKTTYAQWERVLARTTHIVFYVLLIGLPLGGWLASSMFGKGVDMFGLFTIPALPVGQSPDAGEQIFELHATAGTIMVYLIGLHILGALKHTFWNKDGTLFRMLPFGDPKA